MICQLCGKNQATVCLNIDMNGQRSTIFICEECAESRKVKQNPSPALILSLINEIKNLSGEEPNQNVPDAVCESCGLSYADYLKTSLLGCPKCYTAFEEFIKPVIAHITKPSNNNEINSEPSESAMTKEILKLQLQLKRCIENENYEEAAKLRDRINSIKNPGEVTDDGKN